MKAEKRAIFLFVALVFGQWLLPEPARAADEQQPQEGDVEVRNFTFHDGERLPLLRLHYTALGTPQRDASGKISNAVLLLHGTTSTGKSFLMPTLAGYLFKPGSRWTYSVITWCCLMALAPVGPPSPRTGC